jgi:hypothetical protein
LLREQRWPVNSCIFECQYILSHNHNAMFFVRENMFAHNLCTIQNTRMRPMWVRSSTGPPRGFHPYVSYCAPITYGGENSTRFTHLALTHTLIIFFFFFFFSYFFLMVPCAATTSVSIFVFFANRKLLFVVMQKWLAWWSTVPAECQNSRLNRLIVWYIGCP